MGPRESLRTEGLLLRDTNWLGDATLLAAAGRGLPLHVRVRSSQPPRPATLFARADESAIVVLRDAEDGIATGQACVFYEDAASESRVLGGGFIARTMAPGVTRLEGAVVAG